MLDNRFNFLVWSANAPEPEDLSNLPLGGNYGKVSAVVILAPGDLSYFYINAPLGIDAVNATVSLVSDTASLRVVAMSVGAVTAVNVPGLSKPQYYGRVSAPSGLKEEYYRLMIGNAGKRYYSNRIWYKPSNAGVNDMSAVFSFRSARNLAYIPYELPELATFRQVLRLACIAGNPQNDTTVEKYNGVTTGRVRTVSILQNLFRTFTVESADAIAHEGFTAMLSHKDLLVNGMKFSLKTGYNSGTDTTHLATGTFELWETAFALVTRC